MNVGVYTHRNAHMRAKAHPLTHPQTYTHTHVKPWSLSFAFRGLPNGHSSNCAFKENVKVYLVIPKVSFYNKIF
jgi:hypothetical protein